GDAADLRTERNLFPVGRPRWIEDLAERRKLDLLDQVAVIALHDAERRPAGDDGTEREAAVGAPRACRVDELHALEVRIAGRGHELADRMSVLRVGEIHVDREQPGVREVHHPRAVGAQCRRVYVVLVIAGADGPWCTN